MTTKQLILNYFHSWQTPADFEEFRSYLAEDCELDFGLMKVSGTDKIYEFAKQGNPWKDVQLLDTIFTENKGALFYEGTDAVTNIRNRVAEMITVQDGKIVKSITNFSALVPPSQ